MLKSSYTTEEHRKKLEEYVAKLQTRVTAEDFKFVKDIYEHSDTASLVNSLHTLDQTLRRRRSENSITSLLRDNLPRISALHNAAVSDGNIAG
jgi:hypothetical protein